MANRQVALPVWETGTGQDRTTVCVLCSDRSPAIFYFPFSLLFLFSYRHAERSGFPFFLFPRFTLWLLIGTPRQTHSSQLTAAAAIQFHPFLLTHLRSKIKVRPIPSTHTPVLLFFQIFHNLVLLSSINYKFYFHPDPSFSIVIVIVTVYI